MFDFKSLCTFCASAGLWLVATAGQAASGSNIVFDAEFIQLRAQHADEWAKEDAALRQKLAEMQKKHGKRPNIIHIMWDDHSLGEVGIRQMNKLLGYDTPRINQMADEGSASPACIPSLPVHPPVPPRSPAVSRRGRACTRWDFHRWHGSACGRGNNCGSAEQGRL